jgi:hypothetical protein
MAGLVGREIVAGVVHAAIVPDEKVAQLPGVGVDELRSLDVLEELYKFTLLTRGHSEYLVDRYSERKESAEALMQRVNQRS